MVWFVETCRCLTEAVDTQGQLLGHVCFMVTDERGRGERGRRATAQRGIREDREVYVCW